ncbi:hypothetical protein BG003_010931, partial [Podila horticola]
RSEHPLHLVRRHHGPSADCLCSRLRFHLRRLLQRDPLGHCRHLRPGPPHHRHGPVVRQHRIRLSDRIARVRLPARHHQTQHELRLRRHLLGHDHDPVESGHLLPQVLALQRSLVQPYL